MKSGIERIAEERKRQIESEGWDKEHDSTYCDGQLSIAAACYAMPRLKQFFSVFLQIWPFGWDWWKPTPNDRIRDLEKAGALIAAEIDRIQNDE